MRLVKIVLLVIVFIGCKKSEVPQAPESAKLVFPTKNSECTTGTGLSATTTQVEFKWQAALNTDTYELRVTNVDANSTQTISTPSLSAKLPLEKGTFYSWSVRTKNSAVLESVSSETWQFYNSGFETSHAPFPVEIVSPKMGMSVFLDSNNQVELSWTGVDIDNDIEFYEVYFSANADASTLVDTFNEDTSSLKVTVVKDTVYYWKIITKDKEGHTSNSGVYSFRAL